jgi:hypothetical protein
MSPNLPNTRAKPRPVRLKEMRAQETPARSVSKALATVGREMENILVARPDMKFPSIVLQSSK